MDLTDFKTANRPAIEGDSIALSAEYIAEWQEWHNDRVEYVTQPYGIMAVICQGWLTAGELFTYEFVPGCWFLEDGKIFYLPDPEGVDVLTIDGKEMTARTLGLHRHNINAGNGSGVSVVYRDVEVETTTRVNARDETIYAVRVRDPMEAAWNTSGGLDRREARFGNRVAHAFRPCYMRRRRRAATCPPTVWLVRFPATAMIESAMRVKSWTMTSELGPRASGKGVASAFSSTSELLSVGSSLGVR